ncbi:MAG: phosphoribosylformylglycinamidine synthase subunit PurQ, partial [Candidatus Kaiserbacteria bacterium]|nr:phosphoribosylformylglycinamidine synthase subunit PurQ [Candidatus Kaiserbacteria bacterium]
YANRVRQHLGERIEKFLARDTLMAGICNGFQIITSARILSGALLANDGARYLCRWVDLEVTGKSPWLTGLTRFSVPIAHGEGKFYADAKTLDRLQKDDAVALKYVEGETAAHFSLSYNPNGSMDDIAGISGYGGRVLGLMPHPERATRFTQLPHWTYLREQYLRDGIEFPEAGPGLAIFKNAVQYFS